MTAENQLILDIIQKLFLKKLPLKLPSKYFAFQNEPFIDIHTVSIN